MKFVKFNSIHNSHETDTVNRIERERAGDKDLWMVTEKIHGSNFSYLTNGVDLEYCSRVEVLAPDSVFYNYLTLGYEENAKNLFKLMKSMDDSLEYIQIYGELFGGSYPHKDVEADKGSKRVQKKVFYHPSNKFAAFGIRKNGGPMVYPEEARELLAKAGFFLAPLLKSKVTLEEALKVPNDTVTKIPELFGLPPIEGNIIEGLVVEPMCGELFLTSGSRAIIKHKNAKFAEKSRNRVRVKKDYSLNEEEQAYLDDILSRVTENRLDSVVSKEGEFTRNDIGKFLGLMTKDIMVEFVKENEDYLKLDKETRKKIERNISPTVVALFKEYLSQEATV